jgi:phage tail protein X
MELPAPVTAAWSTFAKFSPWDAMDDIQWTVYSGFVAACADANLGYAELEEFLIENVSIDGAPDFLAGELAAGLEVGTRVLKMRPAAPAPAPVAAAPVAAAPVETPEAKAAREAAEAAKIAEEARLAAMAKLSPEERKALGL